MAKKVHIRAAHMEVGGGEADGDHILEDEPAITKGDEMVIDDQQNNHNDEDKMVEVDVYKNDWYEQKLNSKQMFTKGDQGQQWFHETKDNSPATAPHYMAVASQDDKEA